jgi:hypothetical protein
LKPLLNDGTLAVVHLDLAKINVTAILENNRKFIDKMFKDRNVSEAELKAIVAKMVPESPEDFEASWKNFVKVCNWQQSYFTNRCGIQEAFVVIQLGKTFPVFWYVAIPKTDKLNIEEVKKYLKGTHENWGFEEAVVRETDDYLFFSYPTFSTYNTRESLTEKLGKFPKADRPDFISAFDNVQTDPIKIVVAIPSYVNKIVSELKPQLPESLIKDFPALGKIDIAQLVNGVKYTATGINPEKGTLSISIRLKSKDSALQTVKQMYSILFASLDGYLEYLKSLKEQSKESIVETPEDTLVSLYPDLLNEKTIATFKKQLFPLSMAGNVSQLFEIKYDSTMLDMLFADSKVSALRFFQVSVTTMFSRQKRVQCQRNLKEILLAMHNYHDVHGKFPPAYSVDKDGKPLHSWRVHLLPYLENVALYKQIKLDEPWDSEHNKQFHDMMPKFFACPANTKGDPKRDTVYSVIVGDKTAFRTDMKTFDFGKITDGSSNTIAVVERVTPVNWMSPEDVKFEDAIKGINKIPEGIGSEHYQSVNCALFDGSVHTLRQTIDLKSLEALLTISGGEAVNMVQANK